jgi:hypothetical protein
MQGQSHTSTTELSILQESFWRVVIDSLVELHGLRHSEAIARVGYVRSRASAHSSDPSNDIIFHSEPFDVACRLAKQELPWENLKGAYERIVDRHHYRDI